ncbi:MAG TPA: DUF2934 domain-containing protein, partial [Puia sp.]|nr:DUF2934 domain-containing protein [Puia sp.]
PGHMQPRVLEIPLNQSQLREGKEMVKTIAKPKTAKAKETVSREELEVAAYYHWLNRGCPTDDSLTDWIEVEAELNHKAGSLKK